MSVVTIIIPYKNNLKYLFLALESIFIQTYKNYKILVIYDDDDKSDLILLKKFINKKKENLKFSIQILVNNKNLGAGQSRNIGIKHCKTKYIAFLDSDDFISNYETNLTQPYIRYLICKNLGFKESLIKKITIKIRIGNNFFF